MKTVGGLVVGAFVSVLFGRRYRTSILLYGGGIGTGMAAYKDCCPIYTRLTKNLQKIE